VLSTLSKQRRQQAEIPMNWDFEASDFPDVDVVEDARSILDGIFAHTPLNDVPTF